MHFEKKGQVYHSNISEVIDSEKYGYLNTRKLLFQNTLRESTCSRILNTADTSMGAILSERSFDPTHIEFGEIFVRENLNRRTV